jgi:energy-converting hydrogenase Eha subunit C
LQAASDGDKRAVRKWIEERHTDVNATDWDNLTALIAASSQGMVCAVLLAEYVDGSSAGIACAHSVLVLLLCISVLCACLRANRTVGCNRD